MPRVPQHPQHASQRPVLGRFALWGSIVLALVPFAWANPPSAAAPSAQPAAAASAHSEWTRLSAEQRRALAPLASSWERISEAQRRKWIALSANFSQLPASEQALLQARMSDWAALSPQQRTQARLNFGETRKVSPDERRAKWDQYQALPDAERQRLAASAVKTPSTAAALKPAASQRMATIAVQAGESRSARIAQPGSQWRQPASAASAVTPKAP